MFNIGEFSVLSGLNKKTLRYYDEIGLLKPNEVNISNQYRIYSEKQLEMAKKIKKLRGVGVSLKNINKVLKSTDLNVYKSCISNRINEIDTEIKDLKIQKENANLLLREKGRKNKAKPKYIVKPLVIEAGDWFEMNVEEELHDIHLRFSDYYDKLSAMGAKIIGHHMIGVKDGQFRIVARVEAGEKSLIESRPELNGFMLEDLDLTSREEGYIELLRHGSTHNFDFNYYLETYKITSGSMKVSIFAVIAVNNERAQ